mgnify:CR=1
ALNFGQYMAGKDHRHAPSNGVYEFANALNLMRVEPDGWLVHKDDFRFAQKCIRNPDSLAKALRECADDF